MLQVIKVTVKIMIVVRENIIGVYRYGYVIINCIATIVIGVTTPTSSAYGITSDVSHLKVSY